MHRLLHLAILMTMLWVGLGFSACQRRNNNEAVVAEVDAATAVVEPTATEPVEIGPTATIQLEPPATVQPEPTATPTPANTPTETPSPTITQTPTPTLTPTDTPVPSERLTQARRAFHNGQYGEAQSSFAALAGDVGASSEEQELGLFWRGRSENALGNYSSAVETFGAFASQFPASDLVPAASFQKALALEQLGFYSETVTAYEASLYADNPIAAYVYERLGDLAVTHGAYEAGKDWYLAGLNKTADSGFQVHLREGVAAAYLGLKDYDRAITQYQSILDISEIPAYRAKIMRLIGEAHLDKGDRAAAQAQFQQTLDTYPEAYESYLALVVMVNAGLTVDDFQRGYTDYHGGSAYTPAIEAMQRYLNTSAPERADEAHWVIAFSWRALSNYDNAIAEFDLLIRDYPDSPLWGDANLERARTLGWQGKVDAAIASYRGFAAARPDDSLSPEALWRAALWEYQTDRFAEAYTSFRGLIETYPDSTYADDARYRAGLAAYLAENYVGAEQEWATLLTDYPASEYSRETSYWQAKALLNLQDFDQARPLLTQLANQPFNYYGLRARDLLAADNPISAPAPDTPIHLTPTTPEDQVEAEAWLANWLGLSQTANLSGLDRQVLSDPNFIQAEALLSFGLIQEAIDQYKQTVENWRENPLALYQLSLALQERGIYFSSIQSADRLVRLSPATDPETVPNFIRRLIYPVYYADLILPLADSLQLDPALVFALIRQESFYDPNALSVAGARGLMQIMPPTGADIAQRTNTAAYTLESLWQPYRNIQFGIWYLRQMLNYFDNNQFAALAAYNAGPGRVEDWSPLLGDLDIFVAHIPLAEPQNYIRRIYLNLANYREIYGEAPEAD